MPEPAPGPELPVIAECRLDVPGLQAQRERYRRLGERLDGVYRTAQSFTACFDEAVDLQLLEEAIAVERDCCPFFELALDADERQVTVSVQDSQQAPALEALVHALTARS